MVLGRTSTAANAHTAGCRHRPCPERDYEVQFNYVIPLCDEYSIPLATNIATAEMLLKGMNNGDLEWRNLYR